MFTNLVYRISFVFTACVSTTDNKKKNYKLLMVCMAAMKKPKNNQTFENEFSFLWHMSLFTKSSIKISETFNNLSPRYPH